MNQPYARVKDYADCPNDYPTYPQLGPYLCSMAEKREISPALREEICARLAEGQPVLRISRETGIGRSRIERIRDSRTPAERTFHASTVRAVVQTAARSMAERRADEVESYAVSLMRVRSKALARVEQMLDAIPADDPQSFPLLKDIGKVLRDLHEMSAVEVPGTCSDTADAFYQLLKSPSTINIQNNYYGKKESEPAPSGDRSRDPRR